MNKEERIKFYKSKAWQYIRYRVLERDNYECQECKRQGRVFTDFHKPDKHKRLDIDHIKSLARYPELALEMQNLETLCVKCHNKKENRFHKFQSKNKWRHDEFW